MLIDLASPLWGGMAASLVVASVLGIYGYARVVVENKVVNKKLSDLLSELDSLQKSHKKEISHINKTGFEAARKIIKENNERMQKVIDKYQKYVSPEKIALLEHIDKIRSKNPQQATPPDG